MTPNHATADDRRGCPRCGGELPPGGLSSLCPKCLLAAGMDEAVADSGTVRLATPPPPLDPLASGQAFGHYRILRPIGGGGMGSVFEAEDLETGRRVALKLLSHTLDSPEARERFFREGRLAASINHPNSVYVFGTEEIGGTPVISMEYVTGGTLQDRVRAEGAMPWAQAVDAALQIIAGLEAAQRVGILHRDVKPSNCFLDPEGITKIGDFGLSISTELRTEPSLTATGAFLGTPAFCSPEQLRGEELSVRSDIYSVGATLFFLLTGRTPFEGKNVVAMLATVLEQPAPSPRTHAPQVPHGLGKVVRRCLEKQPSERFRSYPELREALAPYGSSAPVAAGLGFRFLAGVIDMVLLNLVFIALSMGAFGDPMRMIDRLAQDSGAAFMVALTACAFCLCYYGLAEGIRGATPGKALCRLRVVGKSRNAPGLARGFGRAAIYVLLPIVPFWLVYGYDYNAYLRSSQPAQYLLSLSYYLLLAALFSTARKRNGLASVHDLLSGTRVIFRHKLQQRPSIAAPETASPVWEGTRRIGAYHVLETLDAEWILGYDLRLLRKVWIRLVPSGTPPVSVALRNLGRPGRLRWLSGKRAADENWDVYEAPGGQALPMLAARQPQRWSAVRYWLSDLAEEINAATREGDVPELAPDRVWITAEGRAKLLDFAAPGWLAAPLGPVQEATAVSFLTRVAGIALSGQPASSPPPADVGTPLPLHARTFLSQVPGMADAAEFSAALKPLLQRATEVSHLRRAAIVAGCVVLPVPVIIGAIFGTLMLQHWKRAYPGVLELQSISQARWALRHFHSKVGGAPSDRDFAIYIASHFRGTITNEAIWSNPIALLLIKGEARRFAEQSLVDHPAPAPEEAARTTAALKPYIPKQDFLDLKRLPGLPLMAAHASLVIYVGFPAVLAALIFRGGLVLLICGVTFVRRDGARASRLRLLWRAVVAWTPAFLSFMLVLNPKAMQMPVRQALVLLGLGLIAALSVAMARSLPDRMAGTWPVLK